MKNMLITLLVLLTLLPSLSNAGEFLTGDEFKQTFCNTTSYGENLISGWTFNIYFNEGCKQLTVNYLTGDKAGSTFNRAMVVYPSGDVCINVDGKEKCEKVKAESNGVYYRHGRKNGYKDAFAFAKNIVSGNRL